MIGIQNPKQSFSISPELWKDICGCLITFEYDDDGCYETAKLAHYTVRVSLKSNRITKGPASYFHLKDDEPNKTFLISILQYASDIQLHTIIRYNLSNSYSEDNQILQASLDNYCTMSTLFAIHCWQSIVVEDDTLLSAVSAYFSRFAPAYHQRRRFVENLLYYLEVEEISQSPLIPSTLWKLDWIEKPDDHREAILADMLFNGYLTIVDKMASTFLTSGLSTKKLFFRQDIYDRLVIDRQLDIEFSETTIDIIAQYVRVEAMMTENLLVACQLAARVEDFTSVLVSYISSHINHDDDCVSICMIDWLLQHGADANAAEYRVTPLQVAASMGDVQGVETLLKHGAQPDGLGNRHEFK